MISDAENLADWQEKVFVIIRENAQRIKDMLLEINKLNKRQIECLEEMLKKQISEIIEHSDVDMLGIDKFKEQAVFAVQMGKLTKEQDTLEVEIDQFNKEHDAFGIELHEFSKKQGALEFELNALREKNDAFILDLGERKKEQDENRSLLEKLEKEISRLLQHSSACFEGERGSCCSI